MTAALLVLLTAAAPAVQWYTDFDRALETASKEKKRVFVYVLDSV
ncbi:MAG: hypothetical protein ACYTGZ_02055 [Planctomycetota bacterium]